MLHDHAPDHAMKEKERRNSVRRDSKSMCEVRIGSEVSRGPVINYAEGDGIGIIIKNNRSVSKGAQSHITIMDTGIEFNAEIAWTEKLDFDFVRIGLRNIRGKPADKKPHDEAVTEKTGDVKENFLKQSPDAQPEKTTSQEEVSVPGREYVRDDKKTEDAEPSAVQPAAAPEKVHPGKKWPYVLAASLLVMLLGGTLSFLHNKNKSTALPQSTGLAKHEPHTVQPPSSEVTAVEMPSFRDAALAKAMTGRTERAAPLPDFREEALSRFQRD